MGELAALWAIFLDRLDEHRWSRQIVYVAGPTCIQYAVEPHSHKDQWPMKRAELPLSEACRATLEAVVEKLDPPSNVRRFKKERV